MNKLACLFTTLGLIALCGCGGGGGGDQDAGQDAGPQLCDLDSRPCPQGQRCTADQVCVDAQPLEIVTESLPDGRVGFGYNETLEVTGGLPPYVWEIASADPELGFLSIGGTGRLQGSAEQSVQGASITIAVTDAGYAGGERAERSYSLSFDLCRDGGTELCYAPSAGACYQGSRTCADGQMGDCVAGLDLSADKNQCGPDCDRCDAASADSCHQGLCACGAGPLCAVSDNCCDGNCIDTVDATAHCGMCFNDCVQAVAHATAADKFCASGICDYSGDCDYGFLDCDSQGSNGCERPADRVEACGACDVDCMALITHVPSPQKICHDPGGGYICDYIGNCTNDFADCDAERENGCETWLTESINCGACGIDCAQSLAGSLCISPDQADPYFHECGCNFDSGSGQPEGCGAGQICCEHACRDAATESDHCGVCRAVCSVGACVAGACGCVGNGDCPTPSSATSCGGAGQCICTHKAPGTAACDLGQFCCAGDEGGSGGPDGGQDIGCCAKRCGQNDSENYPCTW